MYIIIIIVNSDIVILFDSRLVQHCYHHSQLHWTIKRHTFIFITENSFFSKLDTEITVKQDIFTRCIDLFTLFKNGDYL